MPHMFNIIKSSELHIMLKTHKNFSSLKAHSYNYCESKNSFFKSLYYVTFDF